MGDFPLDGSAAPIDLGLGFRLIPPGLFGQGRTHDARQPGMRAGPPGRETAARDDALMLEVPDTGPEWGHIVLEIGEGGVMRWHLPLADDNTVATPTTRGTG